MSDLELARTDPEALLWRELDKVHAGMLGIDGSGQHMQPMAQHVDRDARRLWFLTKRDTDLFRTIGPGSRAHFVVISKAHDFHACIDGPIREATDRAVLDRIWTAPTAAWFDGKDDPLLAMLAMDLEHAGVWASTASTLAFAWEVAKANASDRHPDVGVRADVGF